MSKSKKPWGGRFRESTDQQVEEFTASIHFDKRLFRYDIEGSIAHCRMLARKRIVTAAESKKIIAGLREIGRDMEEGTFSFQADCEDIHMAVEKALIKRVGEAGGKLHTGRSRNDQVSLDVRLYLRSEVRGIRKMLGAFMGTLTAAARRELDTILPGYTHLQRAQPVLLAHYLLAFREMLRRDSERLEECLARINVMPLGSAALAGTGIPVDREYVARLLKFPGISRNSMDAVSDRDFIAEFIFDAALLMMHLSRFCEDLIIWSSDEFGFAEISDAFTTGSSIMPQKKNPDVAELIRGKTGRIYGNLVTLLTVLKALPMTYNRDLQEDKEPLFDTVDTVKASLSVLDAMVKKVRWNRKRMREAATEGYATATDLAECLVKKGVPFREAHGIVGRLVAYAIEKGVLLGDLDLDEMRRFYPAADEGIYRCLDVEHSLRARAGVGGTSRQSVLARLKEIDDEKAS
ncbi:MAG: argininosuccinate lyase [Deltaproteobacteria bacterium]|nr:argininosuccinate lyase [Deltaproteobacteria bacterium]